MVSMPRYLRNAAVDVARLDHNAGRGVRSRPLVGLILRASCFGPLAPTRGSPIRVGLHRTWLPPPNGPCRCPCERGAAKTPSRCATNRRLLIEGGALRPQVVDQLSVSRAARSPSRRLWLAVGVEAAALQLDRRGQAACAAMSAMCAC